jgi:hypothetical protein
MLPSLLLAALALPCALAAQIPVINGVIGGVPSAVVTSTKVKQSTLVSDATSPTTPGALRSVKENSGVCGAHNSVTWTRRVASRRVADSCRGQKRPRAYTRRRVMRISHPTRACCASIAFSSMGGSLTGYCNDQLLVL